MHFLNSAKSLSITPYVVFARRPRQFVLLMRHVSQRPLHTPVRLFRNGMERGVGDEVAREDGTCSVMLIQADARCVDQRVYLRAM